MIIKKKIGNIIEKIENQKNKFETWFFGFLGIVLLRMFIEIFLNNIPTKNGCSYLFFLVNDFLLIMTIYLFILIFLIIFTKDNFKKLNNILFYGAWLVLLPPIIDRLVFKESLYKNFYIFDSLIGLIKRFFLFYGDGLSWGITIGGRIFIFLSIILLSGYYFYKKNKILKTFFLAVFLYSLFFIFNSLPTLITFILEFFRTGTILEVSRTTVVGYFMSPFSVFGIENNELALFLVKKMSLIYYVLLFISVNFLYFLINKKKYLSLIKNIRPVQVVYNWGLLFLGLSFGFLSFPENFQLNFFTVLSILVLVIVVFCSWVSSVLINDLSDLAIDKISNTERPLIKKEITAEEYKKINIILVLFLIIGAFLIKPLFVVFVVLYYFLTWFYSCKPFRFKRIFLLSNTLIAFSSLLFLLMGFIVFSGEKTLSIFPWKIYWFLFWAYFLITPLKDLKDFEGDKKNKSYTLPVLVGKKNTRLIIASFLFSFYLASVYILNKQELFLSALIFGVINFLIVNNNKISEKIINYWVLGSVFIYGLWIVKVVFM